MNRVFVVTQQFEYGSGIRVFASKDAALHYFKHYFWLSNDFEKEKAHKDLDEAVRLSYFETVDNGCTFRYSITESFVHDNPFVLGWD